MWSVSAVGDYRPRRPIASDLLLCTCISWHRFSFCSGASFPPVSKSHHQIIFKFTPHTLWASLRISTPERHFCGDNAGCTGIIQLFWPRLKPIGLFYFQRQIAWTFVEKGHCSCITTEDQWSQKILMYDQQWILMIGLSRQQRYPPPMIRMYSEMRRIIRT